jgi:hypothetical protein
VISDWVCGMLRCIAEGSAKDEIVVVTLRCVRGGLSVEVEERVSQRSMQEPLLGKVGRDGCRVVRWEMSSDVRAM